MGAGGEKRAKSKQDNEKSQADQRLHLLTPLCAGLKLKSSSDNNFAARTGMANSEIEQLERRVRENPLTFARLADAHRRAGGAERALEVLRDGLERYPDYVPASIVLGRTHLDLGDDPSAELAFQRVLSLDPENVIALKALADTSERQGRFPDAERWLQALLAIDRSNDAARDQLARVQEAGFERGRMAEIGIENGAASPASSGQFAATMPAQNEPPVSDTPVAELPPEPVREPQPEPIVTSFVADGAASLDSVSSADAGLEFTRFGDDSQPAIESQPAVEERPEPGMAWVTSADAPVDAAPPVFVELEEQAAPPLGFMASSLDGGDRFDANVEMQEEIELRAQTSDEFVVPNAADAFKAEFGVRPDGDAAIAAPDGATSETAEDIWANVDLGGERVPPALLDDEPAEDPYAAVTPLSFSAPPDDLPVADALTRVSPEDDFFARAETTPAPEAVADTPPEPPPPLFAHPAVSDPPPADTDVHASDMDAGWAPIASAPPVEEPLTPPEAYEHTPPAEPPMASHAAAEPMHGSLADFAAVPEPADEDEHDEPTLVVTETMASLYEAQGHAAEALLVYRELAMRTPAEPRFTAKIASLEAAQAAHAAPARPAYAAAATGGESVSSFFTTLLARMPAPLARNGAEVTTGGAPTRPADDPLSLSSVFGDDTPPSAATPRPARASAPTFDEFYGGTAAGTKGAGEEDLDQFYSWLQGLKS